MNATFRSFLVLASCLFVGCETMPNGAPYVPVEEQAGRVRWTQANGNRLVADAVFSRDNAGRTSLSIGKETPVLRIFRDGDMVHAHGSLGGGKWTGSAGYLTGPLREWNALLSAWVASTSVGAGRQEVHTSAFRVQFEKTGRRLTAMTVRPTDTRSEFSVVFVP